MTCNRHKKSLADIALGAPMTALLEAHLRKCSECQDFLARERAASKADEASLSALLLVDVPLGLEGRISRGLVAAEGSIDRRPRVWHLRLLSRPVWGAAALTLLLVLPALIGIQWHSCGGPAPAARTTPPATLSAPRIGIPAITVVSLAGYQPIERMRIVVIPKEERP